MNDALDEDTDRLLDQIVRYLAAVDLFRAEGYEPSWRPEVVTSPATGLHSPLCPTSASTYRH